MCLRVEPTCCKGCCSPRPSYYGEWNSSGESAHSGTHDRPWRRGRRGPEYPHRSSTLLKTLEYYDIHGDGTEEPTHTTTDTDPVFADTTSTCRATVLDVISTFQHRVCLALENLLSCKVAVVLTEAIAFDKPRHETNIKIKHRLAARAVKDFRPLA